MDTSNPNLPANILAATERMAAAITSSEPFVVFNNAKAHLDNDSGAQHLLKRLSAVQADIRKRQMNGDVAQTDLDLLRAIQREVQSNPIIIDYSRTQQEAISYLTQINQEISQLLGVDFASLAGPASC
ncbi:MAG: YlbF family regulator [Anaerolineales bacterium]